MCCSNFQAFLPTPTLSRPERGQLMTMSEKLHYDLSWRERVRRVPREKDMESCVLKICLSHHDSNLQMGKRSRFINVVLKGRRKGENLIVLTEPINSINKEGFTRTEDRHRMLKEIGGGQNPRKFLLNFSSPIRNGQLQG